VVPNCADAFAPLRDTINQNSGPQCSENASLKQEKILFSLPHEKHILLYIIQLGAEVSWLTRLIHQAIWKQT